MSYLWLKGSLFVFSYIFAKNKIITTTTLKWKPLFSMAYCIIPHKEADACAMTATFFQEQKQVQSCEMSSPHYCCESGKADITPTGYYSCCFLKSFLPYSNSIRSQTFTDKLVYVPCFKSFQSLCDSQSNHCIYLFDSKVDIKLSITKQKFIHHIPVFFFKILPYFFKGS